MPSAYHFIKEKGQKLYRINAFDDFLLNSVLPMIEYKNFPESVNLKIMERIRIESGAVALFRYDNESDDLQNGDIICGRVDFGGLPYPTGIGRIAIVSTPTGYVKQFDDWEDNPDIAIIFLNSSYSPDLSIGIFSDMLADLVSSIRCNIINARYTNIPVVENEQQRKAIEDVFNQIKNGKATAYLHKSATSSDLLALTGMKDNSIPCLNLTDVKNSDKMQYLTKMYDDILRWFYSMYGMDIRGSSKMAQQSVDEINSDNISSMILPVDMLKNAREGVDMFNKKFGFSASADFSECWKKRKEESEKAENTENENTESEVINNENSTDTEREISGDIRQTEDV